MKTVLKLLPFIFITILSLSCRKKIEDKRLDYIQGEWVFDSSNLNRIDSVVLSRIRENSGLLFRGDTCVLSSVIKPAKTKYICDGMIPGYNTRFVLENDSLKLWYSEDEKWRSFLIRSLDRDSMVLVAPDRGYDLKYVRPVFKEAYEDQFDEIVVEKLFSGEGHDCDMEVFYFNRQGVFLYRKNNGLPIYSFRLQSGLKDRLLSNFQYLDVNNLYSEYIDGSMRWYSIHYKITFLKNGEIVKRVKDSTLVSPDELLRGYIPIVFLPNRLADGGIRELEGDVEVDMERIKRLWGDERG